MKTLIILANLLFASSGQTDVNNCSHAVCNSLPGQGKLSVKFHGRDFSNGPSYNPSFYRQCVTAEIANPSAQAASFSIQAGTLLMPDDPGLQRLMVTRGEHISVKPGSTEKVQLYAMCTQASHGGPGPSTQFNIGAPANESWIKLAELIERNNYQNSAGQGAVWALSDNHAQSGIFDEDTNVTYTLRNYIAQVRHESRLPANAPRTCDGRWFTPVKVEYNYFMYSAHRITIAEDSLTHAGKHHFEKTVMVAQNSATGRTGLKMIRWMDGTLADVHYFTKADSTITRQ